MQLIFNSATLPRKWSSFKKSSSKPPPGPSNKVPSPRKSLTRSSSFSSSNSCIVKPRPKEEGEIFKVPLGTCNRRQDIPPSNSSSLSTFKASPWKSKSFSDLKSQRDSRILFKKPANQPPPPPPPVRSNMTKSSRSISHDSLVMLPPPTASILNKSLRSTSWRNLFAASSNANFGGMNRNHHRLSQGPKKVNPPSVPEVKYPRSSCSSFGSDQNCPEETEEEAFAPSRRLSEERLSSRPFQSPQQQQLQSQQQQPAGGTYSLRKIPKERLLLTNRSIQESDEILKMDDQGIDMTLSPGRDSPGHDSNASSVTLGSASSGGCRNSTTSLDSGRASNSAAESLRGTHLHHPQIHQTTVLGGGGSHHQAQQQPSQRLSYQSSLSSNSSFRQSYHSSSSSSSVGSSSIADHDGIYSFNVQDMIARGHPDHEIINSWLTDLHFEEYYDLFVSAGYDMPTISRMTPEDLTAIGIKKPNHRKKLKMEIAKLNIGDGLPEYIPDSLEEWLHCIRLSEYGPHLRAQGYNSVLDASQITIEDLEDVGIYRLGHQKRFLLAIKRNKDLKSGRRLNNNNNNNTPINVQLHHHPHHNPYDNGHYRNDQQKCQFTSFQQQQPKYHPEIIRIEQQAPLPSALPPDMPRPMPPLQMFSHHSNSFVPRSYDDTDILRAAEESVLIHHHHHHHQQPMRTSMSNGGDGTLPRPKGYVKPRPVAKIVAKTRESPCEVKENEHSEYNEEEDHMKKGPLSPASGRTSRLGSDGFRTSLRQIRGPSLDSSPLAPECDGVIPFANENAGTIRMRAGNSHANDVSTFDWNPGQAENNPSLNEDSEPAKSSHLKQSHLKPSLLQRQGRTAGDVLNDIGSMLADLTDELDAMLHMDKSGRATPPPPPPEAT